MVVTARAPMSNIRFSRVKGLPDRNTSARGKSDALPLPEDLREFGTPKLQVGILLWPEFTLLALSGFVDALRHASDVGDQSRQILCCWEVMSDSTEPIAASCGLKVTPTCQFIDPVLFDYILVVGGRTERLGEAPASFSAYLSEAARSGVPLIGMCTGSFVLAQLGLLDGHRVCVGNYHCKDFAELFPRVNIIYDQLFCIDRDRVTCAGGAASIDLAAHLVRHHCGSDRALKISRATIVEGLRGPQAAQQVLRVGDESIADVRVSRAICIMEQHICDPIPTSLIAARLNTSERQLERRFRQVTGEKPAQYFRRLRLRYGQWLVANSTASISQIAFDTGFSDNSHFTRVFRLEFGVTPSEYRSSAKCKKH